MGENFFDYVDTRKWYQKAYDKIYYRIVEFPSDVMFSLRKLWWFFVRGWQGWAPIDTWSLDYYFSRVIRDSVLHLKKTHPGHPSVTHSPEEWNEILDHISWTFDMAYRVASNKVYMFEKEDFESEERYLEVKKAVENNCSGHIATDEEIQKYKEGWKLFEKYFFCLWS